AVVEVPQGMYDGYLTVLRDANGKNVNPFMTFKDELYYAKQDLEEQRIAKKGGWSNTDNVLWYHLGNRDLPVPQELQKFSTSNNAHVFNLTNNGVKDFLFRLYESDKYDYP